jgi:hypothetical protein
MKTAITTVRFNKRNKITGEKTPGIRTFKDPYTNGFDVHSNITYMREMNMRDHSCPFVIEDVTFSLKIENSDRKPFFG